MSNVTDAIVAATEQIQNGNAADLKQGLQKIANLSKQQMTANQTAITYPLQMLTQAVDRNLKANQDEITPQLGLGKLLKQTTGNLPQKLKKQLTPSMRYLQKQTQEAEKVGLQEKIKGQVEALDLKRQLEKEMKKNDVDVLKLQNPPKIFVPTNLSPLEQQIYPYRQIIDLPTLPQITRPQQLPQTMQLLSNYARIQGLKPIGSASNKGGLAYVGVKEIDDEALGVKSMIPYQMDNNLQKKSIPSISMQLQYYANKTMNNWNNYVDSQSQFVNFMSKINTPTNRQSYLQKQFRTLNIATFSAQAIATIAYYYLYLPLLKMASNLNTDPTLSATKTDFINRYQVGITRQNNPLYITKSKASNLANKMFQLSEQRLGPFQFFQKIKQFMKNDDYSNALNVKNYKKLETFVFDKTAEAKQFMANNGLQLSLVEKVLASKDWSSVKKKKTVGGRGSLNPYVAQLAKKIVKQDSEKPTEIKKIDFSWSSQEIIAYDYMWGGSQKF